MDNPKTQALLLVWCELTLLNNIIYRIASFSQRDLQNIVFMDVHSLTCLRMDEHNTCSAKSAFSCSPHSSCSLENENQNPHRCQDAEN